MRTLPLTQATQPTTINLGFLTVLRDATGYLGGYLVTNQWGRPVEFRLTTAVQPNRVQQILYGATLDRALCADLIGKALFEKTAAVVQLVLTDAAALLDLRRHVGVPVAFVPRASDADGAGFHCHAEFPEDEGQVQALLRTLDASFDLAEPFTRIREAVAEARKLGVTSRAA